MLTGLANVSIPIADYDEAIRWYTETLGLELRMDGSMGGDYRFVTVGVSGQNDVSIVLHKAPQQLSSLPSLLFHLDDCRGEVERLRTLGVRVTLEPEGQPWGTQAVIEDPCGNSIAMLEPSPMALG